jgi:hypothetical protein
MKVYLQLILALCLMSTVAVSQSTEHSVYDFGKMWTFEQPPIQQFQDQYGINADEEWFEDVRLSALKFASWCSASFVSPDGLIMTNHHCSRDEAIKLQSAGENFDKAGFVAAGLGDERQLEGLFVEQLINVEDITERVLAAGSTATDSERMAMISSEIEKVQLEYENNADWAGLRLQVVSFYSGGRYSLYGYKKYEDIRLVFIPENDLGFYGGDPDNFTYPRYNLDCTFWRAYDEDGKPLDTSDHYFKFNPAGAAEGEPVFVIGNPGRTERYRTVAQLEYDRDYRYKQLLSFLTHRRDNMQVEYDAMVKDPSKEGEAQVLLGTINNLSNGIKAYSGILGGLHDPILMGRKIAMEEEIKSKSPGINYWDDLEEDYAALLPDAWAITHLAPSAMRGKVLTMMHDIANYDAMVQGGAEEAELDGARQKINEGVVGFDKAKERVLFSMLMDEIEADIYSGDMTLSKMLDGKSKAQFIDAVMSSEVFDTKAREKCFGSKNKYQKSKDALTNASMVVGARYNAAGMNFQASSAERRALESKIANQVFNVYGTDLPPDATFTLRISDGVVKGYEYNGTVAPANTTYYGMYDRHYSNGEVFPWSLPDRWLNPPMELLKSPMNFVSTNDIIGGNSGSAIINAKGEAVGLIFDGNFESLPGNFIFDQEYNRAVSVHAGGIYSALKYIYKAERLVEELGK